VSVDADGTEDDFLFEYFQDPYEGLSMVFLKGYQWPFDPQKAQSGSSRIDLLVHRERTEKKRRVYLDFTRNPFDIDFTKLSEEAYAYLQKAGATFGTPMERLAKMNAPAIALYQQKGVDLGKEYLEIALCAQHCNGGVAVDLWWQSSVKGLFAVGECAGTHGISRPGGSALNAGQVGALRAAQYIAQHPNGLVDEDEFLSIASNSNLYFADSSTQIEKARRRMSDDAAAVRDPQKINALLRLTLAELKKADDVRLADTLATQAAVLTAMAQPQNDPQKVQEVALTDSGFVQTVRNARPIPSDDSFFENVWRSYRENKNIY
jgi:succinate dehydrogenase/fumarate reductase flavoprotein subunit